MPILYLSYITFTDQDDIVPQSGKAVIRNSYDIVNTLAGNDIINADNELDNADDYPGNNPNRVAFYNQGGTLNTAEGNDSITGIVSQNINSNGNKYGILNEYKARIDTGNGDDIITGIVQAGIYGNGIGNVNSSIDTGDGNDEILGISATLTGIYLEGFYENSSINTGNGQDAITGIGLSFGIVLSSDSSNAVLDTGKDNDTITGIGGFTGIRNSSAIHSNDGDDIITGNSGDFYGQGIENFKFMDTGEGNDTITGIGGINGGIGIYNTSGSIIDTGDGNNIIIGIDIFSGIVNNGTINTGNNEDSIISQGTFSNRGLVFLKDGNDSIAASAELPKRALENFNAIETGDGNDIITSTGVIYNEGIITTGNGDDSIIVDGSVDGITGTAYGIYNNGGAIITGDGNDSIIANGGFESAPNSSGAWFLGEGDDYIRGYGSGDFRGGNGFDILELTPGSYTVGIWGEGGESPIFTKGNQLMITSEFEKLIAGGTIYDFASLTAGQIIIVS
jgi:hypothetical protein